MPDPHVPVSEPFLSVEHVDFSFGPLQVLFDISVEVKRGEALALLGTNGAGKSTLLNVIAGLGQPSKGRVTVDGRDVTGRAAETLVGEGIVLVQGGHGVFPDMTVAENLDVQLYTLRKDRSRSSARRRAVLAAFPSLQLRINAKAGSMSGGEQQQLALAKAMILEPKLLCLDELSLGLAPVVVQDLLAMVRQINESGTTVVLVEQSLNIACSVCERAVFLEKGQVRFEGPTKQLLERDDVARAVFLGA